MSVETALLKDLVKFADHHVRSRDVDPVYAVLKYINDNSAGDRLWRMWLYLAFYDLGSGLIAADHHPEPEMLCDSCLVRPTGVERRNLRGAWRMAKHIQSTLVETEGEVFGWIGEAVDPQDPRGNWVSVQKQLGTVWGNGRWALYKGAELLQKVEGWPIEPTDMGNAFSSGPRHGLELLYSSIRGLGNDAAAIERLDAKGTILSKRLTAAGIPVDIAEVETILCDYHSLYKGNYYVGHDIDQLQDSLARAAAFLGRRSHVLDIAWEARRATLPHAYLGELQGWVGVDKQRKKAYRETGKILVR